MEVKKETPLANAGNRAIGQVIVAAFQHMNPGKFGIMEIARTGDITQRAPTVKHGVDFSRVFQPFPKPFHGTHLRNVSIGGNAVPFGRHTVEHGNMARKRDRRKNRLDVKRIGCFRAHRVQ